MPQVHYLIGSKAGQTLEMPFEQARNAIEAGFARPVKGSLIDESELDDQVAPVVTRQCKSTTKIGSPCRGRPVKDTDFCSFHTARD